MTHFRPAMTADAGFVPWADTGMRQTLRWPSPMDCWNARRPAYSPCTRVGLHGNGVEPRNLAEVRIQGS